MLWCRVSHILATHPPESLELIAGVVAWKLAIHKYTSIRADNKQRSMGRFRNLPLGVCCDHGQHCTERSHTLPGSSKMVLLLIQEFNSLEKLAAGRRPTHGLASGHVPEYQGCIIWPSERCKLGLIEAEVQSSDHHLVQGQLLVHLLGGEIPDDDVCFEAHVCLLPRCKIAARP